MRVRAATVGDLESIESIYAHYVRTSTCTMQLEVGTMAERQRWFDNHGGRYPVIVADDGEVIGWASLSPYHARPGYAVTVEDSIYIRHDQRGRGIGKALLRELLARAYAHSIIAMISADQPASLRLHEQAGFTKVAHLVEVGRKFDRFIDVVFLQKFLS